jgi:hypothetical protein
VTTGGEVMTDEKLESMKEIVAALQRQIAAEEQRRTNERYRQNIANLGITLDKVELSSGVNTPFFTMFLPFLEWCNRNSRKPFVEWNGLVYLMANVDMNSPLCTVEMLEAM